ncbi:MAG: Flp pilus assembly complex ATPase component TadA, partial [Deltaproteobacteria bacterium]|nr:Flp pilus assembly complex ATPase component TadA [Deltaproteobacteria bacterium]
MVQPNQVAVPGLELLGEILVRECGLSPEQLRRGLEAQQQDGGLIGEVLVKMKAIDEPGLAKALAIQYEMPFAAELPKAEDIEDEILGNLPISFAKQYVVLPIGRDPDSDRVQVAVANPLAIEVLDDVSVMVGAPADGVLAAPGAIVELINKVYGRLREGVELEKKDDEDDIGDSEELVDILDLTDEAPIIRWVNSVLFQAMKERASDIHIEPGEKEVKVRYRVDGRLVESKRALRQYLSSIVARVKIMAGLDIAEKRLPQDGRIRRKIGGKEIDMRVATVPTAAGERVTIRLLDRTSVMLGLADIGFASDTLVQMEKIIRRPNGILLVTGPTGSGKTTTLYACLSAINAPDVNI